MLLHEQAFQLIGEVVILLICLLVVILIIGLILGIVLVRRNKLLFPSLIIFIVNVFYSPLKSLVNLLGLDDALVDNIGIEVRNKVNKHRFEMIPPEEKIIVLPHCLRSAHCEASLKETGIKCTYCGKCAIGIIKKKAEPMGYRVFIVPGSSFVKKIVQQNRFKAVVGVACHVDLNQTMMVLEDFAPQGVLLSTSGCFETKVDISKVLETIGYYEYRKEQKGKKDTESINIETIDDDLDIKPSK
ncbi:hypothetical protein SAMN02910297_00513 [Methanobrevibacter olleyae]|uniref:DUF116 domain-containing protein n=1 Tax=Methanobrevibacter olleyae TaxID=294671 RepID=A0A1I4GLU1_METOL|nr:DUF116 domain-containing protein [Methanobrevibacter olleyae]SFL30066.1 hypothetical protein SAMN02910297_00513 [Methanobrevibacter olleyae]